MSTDLLFFRDSSGDSTPPQPQTEMLLLQQNLDQVDDQQIDISIENNDEGADFNENLTSFIQISSPYSDILSEAEGQGHVLIPSAANGLYCPIHDLTFTSPLYGNLHLEEHLNWCPYCRVFLDSDEDTAEQKMALHFEVTHAFCQYCRGKFENDYYFRRHLADQKSQWVKL